MTLPYASELTLEQYELFESLLNPASQSGIPLSVNRMQVMQAILYVLAFRLCLASVCPTSIRPTLRFTTNIRKWRNGRELEAHPRPSRGVGEGRC
ncbi:hypothetical protein H6F61_21560 [Cyanobacteria bacterium FACHB-472]|nr:hypothetical protein [Cyanobacteria bacterium FACHB-472]